MFRHFRRCFWRTVLTHKECQGRKSPAVLSADALCMRSDLSSSFTVARLSLVLFWILVLRTYMHHYCTRSSYHPSFKTLKLTSRTHLWLNWRAPVFFFFSQMIAHGSWAELECPSVAHWIRTSWRHTYEGVAQQVMVVDVALYIA